MPARSDRAARPPLAAHRRARRRSQSADRLMAPARSARRGPLAARARRATAHPSGELLLSDLALELHDAVDERLGARRTARHVDVDRHDLIDALHERVIVEDAAD